MKHSIFVTALTLVLAGLLSCAAPTDNSPEVRRARVSVIHEMDQLFAALRSGKNLDQLSPMDLALLRGDTSLPLVHMPPDVQRAAKSAAGGGLDEGVFVDETNGVLTAWRLTGNRWTHAGYSDPKHLVSEADAFRRARARPGGSLSRPRDAAAPARESLRI